jgi:iron complex transport system substrate-binding protein
MIKQLFTVFLFIIIGVNVCIDPILAESIFDVQPRKDGLVEIRDALGRKLVLIPRGQPWPPDLLSHQVVEIPVRRTVVLSGNYDLGIMKALGILSTVVGLNESEDEEVIKEILRDLSPEERDQMILLGQWNAPDYERIKTLKPDLILGGSFRGLHLFDDMGYPVIFTYSQTANAITDRLRFLEFLASFYGENQKAALMVEKIQRTLARLASRARFLVRPLILYGDFWEEHPLVHPYDHWGSEILILAGGQLLFPEVIGGGNYPVSLEEFYIRGQKADIFLPTLSARKGLFTKKDLIKAHPILAGFKSMEPKGRVYRTLFKMYADTGEIGAIATDFAYIIHPELYQNHNLLYLDFMP